MPEYTRLTLAQFIAMFPAFATLTQGPYDLYVAKAEKRAAVCLGDFYQDGVELLTAHLLAKAGIGVDPGMAMLASTGATSFKSGTFSASISESVASSRARGGYQATPYGQEYAILLRENCGGPRLVGWLGGPCA